MKGKRFLIGLAALAMTAGGGAMANEIFKWVDEEGNVHYGDRPTGSAAEQLVAVGYRRTDSNSVQKRIESFEASQAVRQEKRAAAAEDAKAAAAKEAEAAEKQKKCETYRARLETYVQSRRLYREDESGERVYLDETETQNARKRVEDLITENCSS